MGFQVVDDLGSYLGMPLFHRWVTRSTYQFYGCDTKLIFFAAIKIEQIAINSRLGVLKAFPKQIAVIFGAYNSLVVEYFEPKDTSWGLIWKLAAPQRVRQFLCLVLRDRLLTNFKTSRRGLVDAATCAIYGNAEETTIHSLRDCYCVHAIWWGTLFGIVCWRIWKQRNAVISREEHCDVDSTIARSIIVDGSRAAAGGVLKDAYENWIVGFRRQIGVASVMDAELWGIFHGLSIAWDRDFKKVWISHISRSSNIVADIIAKKAIGMNLQLQIFEDLVSVIYFDTMIQQREGTKERVVVAVKAGSPR
ncbi:hypothetical protein Gotur_023066 [Gossypium turneri]